MSICQTPFILTPAAKSHILQGEAFLQKQSHMQTSSIQVTSLSPFLYLSSSCFVTTP